MDKPAEVEDRLVDFCRSVPFPLLLTSQINNQQSTIDNRQSTINNHQSTLASIGQIGPASFLSFLSANQHAPSEI